MYRSFCPILLLLVMSLSVPALAQTTRPANAPKPAIYKVMVDYIPMKEAEKKLLLNILTQKRQALDENSVKTKAQRNALHEQYKAAVASKDYSATKRIDNALAKLALNTTNINRRYDRMIDNMLGTARSLQWNSKILRDNCQDLTKGRLINTTQQNLLSEAYVDYAGRYMALRKKEAKSPVEDQLLMAQLRNRVRDILGR